MKGIPKALESAAEAMDVLRHTYITNLIHAGVDPKTVQHLAGHKNGEFYKMPI